MRDGEHSGFDAARFMRAVELAPPVMAVDVASQHLASQYGASAVALLIADLSGGALIRLSHDSPAGADRSQGRESGERVPLAGTPQGRALAAQAIEVVPHEGGVQVCAPVTNRGDAIGILELSLPEAPGERLLAELADAARALAHVMIANRRFTDLYEWGQRSMPLTLAAEVQHRLLPGSFTCEDARFALAGWLEPAGEVAGDTFDFTVERDVLHVSVTDAMGHGVEASILATLLVGALRNARRAGAGLAEQARLADEALRDHVGTGGEFVSGQLARIDLRAGTATMVNAGHPVPLRLRDGRVTAVRVQPDLPFGVLAGGGYRVQQVPLAPGDRLLFVTDGLVERNASTVDMADLMVRTAGMHPREAVQHITRAVRDAADGELQDDATVLCLDWRGGGGGEVVQG